MCTFVLSKKMCQFVFNVHSIGAGKTSAKRHQSRKTAAIRPYTKIQHLLQDFLFSAAINVSVMQANCICGFDDLECTNIWAFDLHSTMDHFLQHPITLHYIQNDNIFARRNPCKHRAIRELLHVVSVLSRSYSAEKQTLSHKMHATQS